MLLTGDSSAKLKTLQSQTVQTVITSPPYFGSLRRYGGGAKELGHEKTPEQYIQNLLAVFREVKRVLKDDGTLWLNLGDKYDQRKNLLGIPWRVAFALQDDGWILRAPIIWEKPDTCLLVARDRPTINHEYVFLLVKNKRYFYNGDELRMPYVCKPRTKLLKRLWHSKRKPSANDLSSKRIVPNPLGKNCSTVWNIPTGYNQHSKIDHPAKMPCELARCCIVAGSMLGDTVLDPFSGSGTTGLVAIQEGRKFIGIDLVPKNNDIAAARIHEERIEQARIYFAERRKA